MLKSILVAVDDSPNAAAAAEFAFTVAPALDATVDLLAVVDASAVAAVWKTDRLLAEQIQATREASSIALLKALADRGKSMGAAVTASWRVASPKMEVFERSVVHDLTMLGRHGTTTGKGAEGPGPVASFVFRRCRKPRLLLNAEGAAKPPTRIYVGYDGSIDAIAGYSVATKLAKAARLPLVVFHANPEGQGGRVLQAFADELRALGRPVPECLDVESSPFTFCVEELGRNPSALFVLGAGGQHRFSDWLLGTCTERLHLETMASLLVCGPTLG